MNFNKDSTKKSLQKPTYKPTTREKKLLEILLNPGHRLQSIIEICKLAKCARQISDYDAFKKPAFVEYYSKESHRLVDRSLAAVINASIHKVVRGNAARAKMLLTVAGVYPGDKHDTKTDQPPIIVEVVKFAGTFPGSKDTNSE